MFFDKFSKKNLSVKILTLCRKALMQCRTAIADYKEALSTVCEYLKV
jgi:hypothetical protein